LPPRAGLGKSAKNIHSKGLSALQKMSFWGDFGVKIKINEI